MIGDGWGVIVVLAAVAYCCVRAFLDLRRKQYALAVIGAAIAVGLVTMPISTHAVRVELPAPVQR